VNSPETTLVDAISAYDVSFNVADGTKLPAAPNISTFGTGEDSETFLYTSLVGNVVSGVTRGFDISGNYGVAKAWGAGEVVARRWTAYDAEAINENATGDVVGPASATDGNLVVFDGTDGRKIKDGGAVPSGGSGGGRNAIINGDCRVNQRGTAYTLVKDAYTWDSDDLTGPDRHEGMATGTAVSAGTWEQTVTATAGNSGYGFKFAGVTLTGTGILYHRHRIEAKDAVRFKNMIASFSVKVYHDVGSNINYTVYVRKANAADNFAAVTAISNPGAISVPTATATTLKYENVSMGDCSNGIEIEIKIECGAVTTKNFEQTELQLEIGSVCTSFEVRPISFEKEMCRNYFTRFNADGNAYAPYGFAKCNSSTGATGLLQISTQLRTVPTLTQIGNIAMTVADGNFATISTLTLHGASTKSVIFLNLGVASGIVAGDASVIMNNNDATGDIFLACEL
jgi:hypothetical protein